MTSLPLWAVYCVAFGTPVSAFLGGLIGHWMARRGDAELDTRAKREESMRTLRWASELAISSESGSAQLGIAALDALSASPWLQAEDQAFIDAVLDALLAEDVRTYRELGGAHVYEVGVPSEGPPEPMSGEEGAL